MIEMIVSVSEDRDFANIAPVKELVRCKNCKHYDGDENSRLGTCIENGVCSTPDWFCADGERKTE